MATIKDIAKLSGYSIGTVSRVINHHPDVSASARQKIEQVIKELNFQPNSNAKLLKQSKTSAVTVLVKGSKNVFFESILEDMQQVFRDNGEEVSVLFLDEKSNEVEAAAQVCAERKPKGLIFLGGNLKYFREGFSAIKVPCVLTSLSGEELGFDNLSSFTTDDKEGAKDAIGYLVKYGHRHIGVIGGSLDREQGQISDYRLSGAMEVISREGLDFTLEKNYEPCMFSMEGGYKAAQKLIRRNKEITAIFALGDMIALGAVRGITDLGKKIPDDISIIGYDGIGYTQFSIPRIATIRQDSRELAVRSVEDLLWRISYQRGPRHERIRHRVIAGESVRKLQND